MRVVAEVLVCIYDGNWRISAQKNNLALLSYPRQGTSNTELTYCIGW